MATTMDVRFAVALTERSMPPVSMVMATASARMPMTLDCRSIELMLSALRKTSGLSRPRVLPIATTATARMMARESKERRILILTGSGTGWFLRFRPPT